jgi:hypothetical protein
MARTPGPSPRWRAASGSLQLEGASADHLFSDLSIPGKTVILCTCSSTLADFSCTPPFEIWKILASPTFPRTEIVSRVSTTLYTEASGHFPSFHWGMRRARFPTGVSRFSTTLYAEASGHLTSFFHRFPASTGGFWRRIAHLARVGGFCRGELPN